MLANTTGAASLDVRTEIGMGTVPIVVSAATSSKPLS